MCETVVMVFVTVVMVFVTVVMVFVTVVVFVVVWVGHSHDNNVTAPPSCRQAA